MRDSDPDPSSADPSAARAVPSALHGRRLDAALEALFDGRTRAAWQKAVRRGEVRVDGQVVRRSNGVVRRGQRIAVRHEAEPAHAPLGAAPAEPEVLHHDRSIVVLNKPAGWLTHPADRAEGLSLVRFVADRFGPLPLADHREGPRAGVVHRLDRGTSGVIVMARTASALDALRDAFRRRAVQKRYLALVHGAPAHERFEVEAPLRPSRPGSDLQLAGPHPDAKPARTCFELRRRLGPASLIECAPTTGRRHQIRVHLAASGLPVVGDPLYRAPAAERARLRERGCLPARGRHALHAESLAFEHPETAQPVSFSAPLAADLELLVRRLAGPDRVES